MKKILLPSFLALSIVTFSQTFVQSYKDRAAQVKQANINSLLTNFANLGVKTTGSVNNNNALAWLKTTYAGFGYTTSQITENTFNYNGNPTTNLIVTKTGTKYPNTYLIICGHYDTIVGPGTNDNGSGTAIILEAARILQSVSSEYSIKFINFTGEEQGLFGSQNYVNTVVNATNPKMNIKLVLNVDEVGGVAGMTNNIITVERDGTPMLPAGQYPNYPSTNNAASAVASDEFKNCIGLYSNLTTQDSYIERSDYMPFDKNNEITTGLYETNQSSKPHSSGDTFANMDPVYVYNIAQAVVGSIQHFSTSSTAATLSTNDLTKNLKDEVQLFPNPATNYLNIGIEGKGYTSEITDISGKNIAISKDKQIIDTSNLANGVYLLTVTRDSQKVTKKFIIKK